MRVYSFSDLQRGCTELLYDPSDHLPCHLLYKLKIKSSTELLHGQLLYTQRITMTINIDEDLILPITTAIVTILFVIGYQTLVPRSYIDELITHEQEAFQDASNSAREVDTLTKELQSYRITIQELESLGASHTQAVAVIKAAEVYSLDPKLLGSLIASESSYKQVHHAIPTVVGLCGINTGCGSTLIYNPYSDAGNIMVAAKLLSDYKKLYHTDLLAVTRYKGYSALGYSQALHVLHIRSTI